jgi:hypothetical protein
MQYTHRILLIISFWVILVCSSCDRNAGEGRRSFKSLAKEYKDAHAKKDVDAFMQLVYFGSGPVSEMTLRGAKANFEQDLEHDIKRITRARIERKDRDRVKYYTLKVLGSMKVEWITNDENTEFYSYYFFGKFEGIYYFLVPGPGLIEEGLKALSEGGGIGGKFPGVEQRAKLALSKWRNQNVDPEPILFWAVLGRPVERPAVLWLSFFDEDRDVIGFGVEEYYVDANGTSQVRLEEYPVFAYRHLFDVDAARIVPVDIRDADQQADKERWSSYIKGEGIDVNMPMSKEYWKETLPSVLISVPELNTVEVNVYLYDRAGHKSEPVELLSDIRDD